MSPAITARIQKARADLKLYRKMRWGFLREGMSPNATNWVQINYWIWYEKMRIRALKERA